MDTLPPSPPEDFTPQRLRPILAVAAALGVCRSTVYSLMDSGELESVKIGRRRLVPDDAIDDYIDRIRDRSAAEAVRDRSATEAQARPHGARRAS